MPEVSRPNPIDWNSLQEHPSQTTVLSDIQDEEFHYFITTSGEKMLFFLIRSGPIKVARLLFPKPDKKALQEFVTHCKNNRWGFLVSVFEPLDFFSWHEEGFTYFLDCVNPVIDKGARCNIKKAIREGVIVRKVDDKKTWMELNDIHNELLKRKNIVYEPLARKKMYETIYSYNNKNTLLYGAFFKDKLISGVVIGFTKKFALYLKTATREEFYSYAPGSLIISTICEQEKNRFGWLDMNIGVDGKFKLSGDIAQIIRFKKQFGVEQKVYTYMPLWLFIVRRMMRFARSINAEHG